MREISDRAAIYANTVEEAYEAIRQLGLDSKKTRTVTPHTRRGLRGCIIDRLILVGDASPDQATLEEMLPAMICRVAPPQVFRWKQEYL